MVKGRVNIKGIDIPRSVDVSIDNITDYNIGKLSTGKNWLQKKGDTSRIIKFTSYSKHSEHKKADTELFESLRVNSENKSLPVIVDDTIRFNGRITKLESSIPVDKDLIEWDWEITEEVDFVASKKEFKTFNYVDPNPPKPPDPPSPPTPPAPSWIHDLLKCTVKYDCKKKKVKCVYYLQDLLRIDNYYIKNRKSGRKYVRDGQWCTWFDEEYRLWQKNKAKVKVTGKYDTDTKNYIKKRYNIK
jgi:hypothetical protein